MVELYNPLDKLNLGRSLEKALLSQRAVPLSKTVRLRGAGVYAIYYTGKFKPYLPVAVKNQNKAFEQPIYVGRAVPKGARKGGLSLDASKGTALRDRLRDHATSIDEASNIELADFHYRSLVIDDIWIPLGENMMIEQFQPIWNLVIDGFGNKTTGSRREAQQRSAWDVLHPGRAFAEKLGKGKTTPEILIERLAKHFARRYVPPIPFEDSAEDNEDQQ